MGILPGPTEEEMLRDAHILLSQWLGDHWGHDVVVEWTDPCRLICDECESDEEWPLPEPDR